MEIDQRVPLFSGNRYEKIDSMFKKQLYSPYFIQPMAMREIADKVHSEGNDLELPCKTLGASPIEYKWLINGMELKRKYRFNMKNQATVLKIKRVRVTDCAVYTCIASNKYGNLSFAYPLNVKGVAADHAPKFYDVNIMKRQKFTVRPTGQTVRFRCEAKGDEPMTYNWIKNGKVLVHRSRKNRKIMDVHGYSLKIKKLELDDAGNYTCIASNKHGSASFSFFLNMLRTREGGRPKVKTYRKREANIQPYVKAKVGQDVSLNCIESRSSTLPYVAWHAWDMPVDKEVALATIFNNNNNSPIKQAKKLYRHIDPKFYSSFIVEPNYDNKDRVYSPWVYDETVPYGLRLNLKNVTMSDAGMYTCSASNYEGNDLAKLFLIVYS
eukprot:gene14405-15905_t